MSQPNAPGAPQMDNFQPTVRVMRLYKPGFHLAQTLSPLPPCMSPSNPPAHLDDFSLSPFLLLPDSFGDIYAGETFSAYIAVVNGYPQIPFQNVSLAVRFQSATTVIDLADVRADPNVPNSPRTLTSNDTFDMIVKQTLTELGVHTLRVSVQYMLTPYGEPKPLRKFYRFNVQQPLVTQSSYREIDGLPMIQCEVTNATKAPIFLDQLTYIPAHKGSLFRAIETGRATTAPTTATTTPPSSLAPLRDCPDLQDQLKILAPGESYAFSFRFTHYPDLSGRSPGFPQVRWCTSMSEYSTYRGENSVKKALGVEGAGVGGAGVSVGVGLGGVGAAGAVQDAGWIKYQCLERPGGVIRVGDEVVVVLRLHNASQRTISLHLDCKNNPRVAPAPAPTGSGSGELASAPNFLYPSDGPEMRPRLLSSTSAGNNLVGGSSPTATAGAGAGAGVGAGVSGVGGAGGGGVGISKSMGGGMSGGMGMGMGMGGVMAQHPYYGLCFTGLTFAALGSVEIADFVDTSVKVYAVSAGLHELPVVYVLDSISGERCALSGVCSLLVEDNEEEEEEEEGAGQTLGQGEVKESGRGSREAKKTEPKPPTVKKAPLPKPVPKTPAKTKALMAPTPPAAPLEDASLLSPVLVRIESIEDIDAAPSAAPSAVASIDAPKAAPTVKERVVDASTLEELVFAAPAPAPVPAAAPAAPIAALPAPVEIKTPAPTPTADELVFEAPAPTSAPVEIAAAPIAATEPAPASPVAAPAPASPIAAPIVASAPTTAPTAPESFPPTDPLFLRDSYLLECDATLLGLFPSSGAEAKHGSHVLVADRTVFHPQGGGQPTDTGAVTLSLPSPATFLVSFVANKNGVLEHYGTPSDGFLSSLRGLPPPLGDLGIGLTMGVDGAVRTQNAACHSAGHAIDVAMQRCGFMTRFSLAATKGYHFPDGPYVEFELGGQGQGEEPTAAELEAMPALLNEALLALVGESIPTTVETLSRAEAGTLCGSDVSNYPERVRVVTVGGLPCPCGGTHVRSSGELGGCKVTKVKRKKRIVKVSYSMTAHSEA